MLPLGAPAGLYSARFMVTPRTSLPLVMALLLLAVEPGCKRRVGAKRNQPASSIARVPRDVLCMEQPEGCIYCSARDVVPAPFLDADQPRPILCHPNDEDDCVEFCSMLAPDCALPWAPKPHCVFNSEIEFQRALFNRDTSDRPEVQMVGRVVDDNGRRIEGVRIDVWVSRATQQTALAQEVSGKDGSFRLRLRSGPWNYSLRFSRAGLASEIFDRLPAEKLAASTGTQPRLFRLGPEVTIKGRITDDSPEALPIADAEVSALRMLEDNIESGSARSGADGAFVLRGLEARRYFLRVTKFGWRPAVVKAVQGGAGGRVTIKLTHATVIRGLVRDKEGDPEPNATVAAVLSDVPGAPTTPIFWATDSDGSFAQDRFSPGTYFLWARKRDVLAYPPEKIELPEGADVEVTLALRHKGSAVKGQVVAQTGFGILPGTRAVLVNRSSPLAFPRPAVANLRAKGHFEFSGMLPGRYEITIRDEAKTLAIVAGPREVEIPIDEDVTVSLKEPIVVRPHVAE
jgi:hypothetical protein